MKKAVQDRKHSLFGVLIYAVISIQFTVHIFSGALLVAEHFSKNTARKKTKSSNVRFTSVVSRYHYNTVVEISFVFLTPN